MNRVAAANEALRAKSYCAPRHNQRSISMTKVQAAWDERDGADYECGPYHRPRTGCVSLTQLGPGHATTLKNAMANAGARTALGGTGGQGLFGFVFMLG